MPTWPVVTISEADPNGIFAVVASDDDRSISPAGPASHWYVTEDGDDILLLPDVGRGSSVGAASNS